MMRRDKLESAALSLFLALLLPVLCLLFLLGIRLGIEGLAQLDFRRAMQAAVAEGLAQYDDRLRQAFGLYGVTEAALKVEGAKQLLPEKKKTSLRLKAQAHLSDVDELKAQVTEYMAFRAPAETFKRLQDKFKDAKLRGKALLGGKARMRLHRQSKAPKAEGEAPEERAEAAPEEEDLLVFLDQHLEKLLPIYEVFEIPAMQLEDALAPSSLEALAGHFDRLLVAAEALPLERLRLLSYVLSHCPAAIAFERHEGGLYFLERPDGTRLIDLPKERQGEAERVLTGLEDAKDAMAFVKHQVTACRFIPQMIAGSQNPERQARYRRWSKTLIGVVKIGSLGSLSLDPETARLMVQVADSLWRAQKDCKALLRGEGLPLWPAEALQGQKPIQERMHFYYGDYLRLLLSLPSETRLYQDLAKVILGDQVYVTAFQVQGQYEGSSYVLEAQYRDAR